nr:MAG TPA: hypothetical protein [Caudoviricetes sp.]DAH45189.1 MAG TPA: hypothetical protein [Caudoviricetes sp.]
MGFRKQQYRKLYKNKRLRNRCFFKLLEVLYI